MFHFLGMANINQLLNSPHILRSKRSTDNSSSLDSIPSTVTVETAVFVDESLYDMMKVTFGGKNWCFFPFH